MNEEPTLEKAKADLVNSIDVLKGLVDNGADIGSFNLNSNLQAYEAALRRNNYVHADGIISNLQLHAEIVEEHLPRSGRDKKANIIVSSVLVSMRYFANK